MWKTYERKASVFSSCDHVDDLLKSWFSVPPLKRGKLFVDLAAYGHVMLAMTLI